MLADFFTRTWWTKRKEWDIKLNDVNHLITSVTTMIYYFLTRTIGNEERRGYGEQFKEQTTREYRNTATKPNMFSRLWNGFARR